MINYGDLVKVKEGFYKGCRGFAVGIERGNPNYIKVEIRKIFKGTEVREKTIREIENNLEKITEEE